MSFFKRVSPGNYFLRILAFLILFTVIIITSLTLIISRLYINDITTNYQTTYQENLESINMDFDNLVQEVYSVYGELIQDPVIYAYLNGHEYDAFISNKAFLKAKLTKNTAAQILSIFLINNNIDYQITTGTYNIDINQFVGDIQPDTISSNEKNIYKTDVTFRYEQNLDSPHTLSLMFSDNQHNVSPDSYIIMNLDPRYINENFLGQHSSELVIMDKKGGVLFQNNQTTIDTILASQSLPSILDSTQLSGSIEYIDGDERKLVSYIRNDLTDTYIFQVNSFDAILSYVKKVTNTILTITLLFLSASFIILTFITNGIYRPVKNLTTTFKAYGGSIGSSNRDEIQTILKVYDEIIHDIDTLEVKNSNQATELAESKLKKLLRGEPLKEEEMTIVDNLIYQQQNQILIVMKLDAYLDIDNNEILRENLIIRSILKDILATRYRFYFACMGGPEWVLLLNFQDESTNSFNDLLHTLKELQQTILKNLDHSLTIGIGSVVNESDDYIPAYNRALDMCKQRFVIGYGQIIHKHMLSEDLKVQSSLPLERIEAINSAIKNMDRDSFTESLKELSEYLANFDYKSATNTLYEIMITCTRTMNSRINHPGHHISFYDFSIAMEKAETLNQTITIFINQYDLFETTIKMTTENINDKHRRIVEHIKAIVENDYSDPNTTIDTIANQVGYSQYYTSKKFKVITGINLNDYIQQKRIDAAKELLKNTNKKVKEISLNVGIENVSYFGYIFKKEIGLTPIAFRQSTQKSEEGDTHDD